ncbi:MAG TPA: slipin family protein [Firmicutes bacterium]|nr:slipin family protein [Bacillota bacterium]
MPSDLYAIARVLLWIFTIWWAIWIIIALFTRSLYTLLFLVLAGVAWFLGGLRLIDTYVFFPYLAIPIALLPGMVKIVAEYQRGVLFRFGRQVGLLNPGINLIFPLGIDQVRKIDLRTLTIDVPKQEIITKDNVPVMVDAVVYFNVFDPVLAVIKVADFMKSTTLLGQTILRSVLGQHDLDDILAKRGELNSVLQKLLDEATDPWGIKVTAVEIKAIELPETMKRAMARQAEAERERRAKVIAAEGEFEASEKLKAAAEVMAKEPLSIQLRYLQTLSEIAIEKNSTIIFPLPMEILRFLKETTVP